VLAGATHGHFTGGAREKLAHEAVRGIWVTDTVPAPPGEWPALHTLSLALLAAAIRRFTGDGSISALF
jgi:phosphoribosylpyrophosphate synthetase